MTRFQKASKPMIKKTGAFFLPNKELLKEASCICILEKGELLSAAVRIPLL
jgi:hypothetical protein